MQTITITITDEQEKALLTDMVNIEDWITNAVNEKIRRVADRIVEANTDKNAKKISIEDKMLIIKGLTLKTALEKNDELLSI